MAPIESARGGLVNKNRQRRHQLYYERLKREKLSYEKFKQADKALPIDINLLTKGKLNARTHNNGTNGRG